MARMCLKGMHFKALIIFSMINLFFINAVLASESLNKKKQNVPPLFTWTGLYVGFNTGYTWTASAPLNIATYNLYDAFTGFGNASSLGGTGTINGQLNGFLSGAQLGYNWQFSEKFIVGMEADLQGAGVRGGGGFGTIISTINGSAVTSVRVRRNLEYLSTIRGRFGYAVTPRFMAYVTGGLALGGINAAGTVRQNLTYVYSPYLGDPAKVDFYQNRTGWTVGAGGEYALTSNTSVKLQYSYFDLGDVSLSTSSFSPLYFTNLLANNAVSLVDTSTLSTKYNGHYLQAGLNYRFDATIPDPSQSAQRPVFSKAQYELIEKTTSQNQSIKIIPYLWALNTNGNLVINDKSLGNDTSIIDAITKSSSFPLAFMGRAEITKGPFWAYSDFAFAQLRFSDSILITRQPVVDIALATSLSGHLRQTLGIGEGGIGYEVAKWKLLNSTNSYTSVDGYIGARYGYIGLNLTAGAVAAANSQLLNVQKIGAGTVEITNKIQWLDPLVGLRMRHSVSAGQNFELRGDIGGFGVGTKFTWQTVGAYVPEIDYDGWKIGGLIGYRALSIDYSNWENGKQNAFNAILHGPIVGVSLKI
ncbi:hypothetical protein LBMAG20_14440 [Methylocystaceae bacterium]|nr:hypothetical protein LBMAG20_14440 [Methylocystaceae bacterium]